MAEGPEQGLADAVSLWALDYRNDPELVIRAACEVVAQGGGGTSLVELAACPITTTRGPDIADLVPGAMAECGLPYPEPGSSAALLAALRAQCRRMLRDEISPRDLAAWAHGVIGHQGPAEAQDLVNADDDYDVFSYIEGRRREDVDAEVRAIALLLARSEDERSP